MTLLNNFAPKERHIIIKNLKATWSMLLSYCPLSIGGNDSWLLQCETQRKCFGKGESEKPNKGVDIFLYRQNIT